MSPRRPGCNPEQRGPMRRRLIRQRRDAAMATWRSSYFGQRKFLSADFRGRKLLVIELAQRQVGHLGVDIMGEPKRADKSVLVDVALSGKAFGDDIAEQAVALVTLHSFLGRGAGRQHG